MASLPFPAVCCGISVRIGQCPPQPPLGCSVAGSPLVISVSVATAKSGSKDTRARLAAGGLRRQGLRSQEWPAARGQGLARARGACATRPRGAHGLRPSPDIVAVLRRRRKTLGHRTASCCSTVLCIVRPPSWSLTGFPGARARLLLPAPCPRRQPPRRRRNSWPRRPPRAASLACGYGAHVVCVRVPGGTRAAAARILLIGLGTPRVR